MVARSYRIHGKHAIDSIDKLVSLDDSVRIIALSAIGIIERQAKKQLSDGIYATLGEGGLLNPTNFKHKSGHSQCVRSIQFELKRQGKCAGSEHSAYPNTWASLEYATFGTVSKLLNNIRSQEAVQFVSDSFSSNNRCTRSWLRNLVQVRNACAHFEPFIVRPQIPSVPKAVFGFEGEDPSKPLYALLVIERLLAGRAEAGIAGAKDDLYNFSFETTTLFSEYADQCPVLAKMLAIPKKYLELQGTKHHRHIALNYRKAHHSYELMHFAA